jgi:inhibitor of the pro-sigma K processing machinery
MGGCSMPVYGQIALGIAATLMIILSVKLFTTPLKLLFKLVFSTLLGFLALFLVNLTSAYTGLSLGLNLLNALVIGILGLPGLVLLLLLKWLFGV